MVSRYTYGPPYPYDCQVAGMGLMLARERGGPTAWHEEKIRYFDQAVQLAAEDRTYAQFPPEVEFPYAVTELWGGMGLAEQRRQARNRYHYALFADASQGRVIKGPRFNAQNAPVAVGITSAVAFNGKLYAAAGRYLVRRDDDTPTGWAVVKDYGASATIGKLAVFRGTQSTSYLFVPLGSSAVYEAMATSETFTAHPSQVAEGFEVIDDELWLWVTASGTRQIRKSTDGGTAATWGAPTTIGDGDHAITWLTAVADRLLVLKEDGLFAPTAASETVDEELAQELRPLAAPNNGKGAIAWNDTLVFPFGGNLYRYDPPSGSLVQIGPELLEENASEVRGQVAGLAGQPGLCLWLALYNAANGNSYLLKYGSWRVFDAAEGTTRQFVTAWHGALYRWSSKQVVGLHVTSVVAGKPRLYVFFADGTIEWCKLARTASPLDDSDYEYDTANTGYLFYPRYTALFPFERKLVKAFGLHGSNLLGGTRTLGVEYKAPTDSTYVAIGTTSTDPGERITLSSQPTLQAVDIRVSIQTTGSNATPILSTLVTYAALRTENLKRIVARIQCGDQVADRSGRPMRASWRDIRTQIEESMTAAGTVTVISPTGEQLTVIGINFGHDLAEYESSQAPRWVETLDMIQTKTVAVRGTWQRASAYTWGDLSTLTWNQVSVI